MGMYNRAFWFDDPQVDTHWASSQGVFTIHSLVEHRCYKIYVVKNFGNHCQKSCCGNVGFATN
jgi:hypothetical protein